MKTPSAPGSAPFKFERSKESQMKKLSLSALAVSCVLALSLFASPAQAASFCLGSSLVVLNSDGTISHVIHGHPFCRQDAWID
jgi:hypothetical protein